MIVFIALRIFTFNCSPASILLAGKTFIFKSSFLDILNPFYAYHSILLFKIAFRHPDSTNIMHPNIMTSRYIRRICRFYEIVIVAFLFFLSPLSHNFNQRDVLILLSFYFLSGNILLLLLAVRTFL